MQYQWLKDDKELSDGDDYQGATTPMLVIVGTGPQVKGSYKCQINNKYRKKSSNGIKYSKL